jgi:AraC family transcriptional regulator
MRTNREIEVFCDWIGRGRLAGIVGREWPPDASGFAIVEGLHRDDEGLWDQGRRLADRIRDPVPGSRACAEALQAQIAVHLLWNHSTLARPADEAEGVADPRLGPVIRYIRENLTEDVSLETLAGVAGLSPNYFLGAFREATGRTPHRYVTEMRVARACELLRDPHRPITEVSLAVGFSSQSHLTEVFRRTLKTTPAAYRRAVLGLSRNGDDAEA